MNRLAFAADAHLYRAGTRVGRVDEYSTRAQREPDATFRARMRQTVALAELALAGDASAAADLLADGWQISIPGRRASREEYSDAVWSGLLRIETWG